MQTARKQEPVVVGGKTLSAHQLQALDEILGFLEKRSDWAMTLQGYAGTGKTTLVQAVARAFNRQVAFTAPTNKATKVLMKMAEREGLSVDCLTIHKMLSLSMADDDKEKYLVKTAMGEGRIYNYGLVVVDEASMIGDKLFEMVKSAAEGWRVPVLFVGDPLQLPPVKDGEPRAFGIAGPRLSQIVRQAEDNPIIAATAWIRAKLEGRATDNPPQSAPDEEGVHLMTDGGFAPAACRALAQAVREGRDVKAIAWRNVTVQEINRAVRATLHGPNPAPWIVGERVIAASPVAAEHLYTDCEATIREVREAPHSEFRDYRCHWLTIETEDGEVEEVPIVHPTSAAALQKELNRLADEAKAAKARGDRDAGWKWRQFWRLKDSFGDLRHCHAITAHRSQGSTYEEVWVDGADIMANRDHTEALKCLYVAISRASKNVWLRDF